MHLRIVLKRVKLNRSQWADSLLFDQRLQKMLRYYQRYLEGDCEAVWTDLIGLWAEVRQEYVYPDAVAVIAETMRRARHNVTLLHNRLSKWGFHFAFPDRALVWAAEGAEQDLDYLETTLGQFPLLAKAWYEFFDSVNFLPAQHNVYFIEELRECFRWGGFRFLEWYRDSDQRILPGVQLAGRELVPALVEGLLPV